MPFLEFKRKPWRGKLLDIFMVASGLIFASLFIIFLLLFLLFGGMNSVIHGNAAQKASKPLSAKIEQAGGKKLCDNGDDGYGIDNITPWYRVYYQIPDSPDLTDEVKGFTSQSGYNLRTDKAVIRQLKENSEFNFSDQEQFNPKSDYLIGRSGGNTLTITINRHTSVPLYCDSGKYGRKQPMNDNTAILDVDFTAPDTK